MAMGKWWMVGALAPVAALSMFAAGCGAEPKFAPEPTVDAGPPPPQSALAIRSRPSP